MIIDQEYPEKLSSLLPIQTLALWNDLTAFIDSLYDVDKLWDKGFGEWAVELKYRRGGKTLCTLYAKQNAANLLIIFGKDERTKFEAIKDSFSQPLQTIYEETTTYHDGKWLWIPLDEQLVKDDVAAMLKIKRRPNRK